MNEMINEVFCWMLALVVGFMLALVVGFIFSEIQLFLINKRLINTKLRLRERLDDYERKAKSVEDRLRVIEQQHTDDNR